MAEQRVPQRASSGRRSKPLEKSNGLVMTPELINEFLAYLIQKGRTPETVATYRSYLNRIYRYLPENQTIELGTLENLWGQMEADGFSRNTINVSISAANSLLEYCGRRDLQLPRRARADDVSHPEMTRAEYQALLRAAKRQGKEQIYLLIKLFACTGINLQELDKVTVETIHAGKVIVDNEKSENEQRATILIPKCLREELDCYICRQNIISGPIFLNRYGQPLNRATVSRFIAALAEDAEVPREKCNPRCLQRLYHVTQETIEKSIFLQVQQMYEYMLEQEQFLVGWETNSSISQSDQSI